MPAGFTTENAVTTGASLTFTLPTGIAFFPDGRLLVAEKAGKVYVVDGTGKHSALDIHRYVHDAGANDDRGLLDVAVDPNFNSNLYVYLLYTADPDSTNSTALDPANEFCYGRLVRYQMTSATSTSINQLTRAILFGRTWPEGPTSISVTHTIGSLRWGSDGSLLVSAGDGAYFQGVDAGHLDTSPTPFGSGKTSTDEDVGAFRAQYLKSLAGKILRLDPATGLGYPSNPFYDGNLGSKQSRVWDYGLRNPFRFCVRPGTGSTDPAAGDPGVLFVGDVGQDWWEELSVGTQGGRNFGWPCYEGTHDALDYPNATPDHSGCGTIGTAENPSLHTPPISDWNHNDPDLSSPAGIAGQAAAGSAFYTGSNYPAFYQGLYFYADYGSSWINLIQLDSSNNPVAFMPFATDMESPVDIVPSPITGDLYYVSISAGEVRHIRYDSSAAGVTPQLRPFQISAAAPNPTHSRTTVELQLPRPARVSMKVLDVQGRQVWASPTHHLVAGRWPLVWDSRGNSAGVYLIGVTVDGTTLTERVAVIR